MPRITKMYTRTGDQGTTMLGTRDRVSKDHPRVEVNGTIDELNTIIGVALSMDLADRLTEILPTIQNELFHLGTSISFFTPEDEKQYKVPKIEQKHIDQLESWIDELNEVVGPLKNFTLPGGAPGAAHLQQARTVCRRAERRIVTLMNSDGTNPEALKYINRLSDLLFVMGRFENKMKGVADQLWDSRA